MWFFLGGSFLFNPPFWGKKTMNMIHPTDFFSRKFSRSSGCVSKGTQLTKLTGKCLVGENISDMALIHANTTYAYRETAIRPFLCE